MFKRCVWLVVLWCLGACQPARELPTPFTLDSLATQSALTAVAQLPTATVTRRFADLPPTFTPRPTETLEPTATQFEATPTLTPFGYSASGTLFYIYNGDSVATVKGDGQGNNIAVTFGIDRAIGNLVAAPDGQLLAFVAPGAGAGREVYISNRDGTYLQQVSCLGYSDVRDLVWTPDSKSIAFFAAPSAGKEGNLYIASYIGANECPTGNQQRVLVPLNSSNSRGLTFSRDGNIVYYAGGDNNLYALQLGTSTAMQVTYASGYGVGDYAPANSPTHDILVFLRTMRGTEPNQLGGGITILYDSQQMPRATGNPASAFYDARYLSWSANGDLLAIVGTAQVYVLDVVEGGIAPISPLFLVQPDAVPSPDGSEVAFTNVDQNGVKQVFVVNRATQAIRQITFNPEGTISHLVWVEG